jgi:hypothetical protein
MILRPISGLRNPFLRHPTIGAKIRNGNNNAHPNDRQIAINCQILAAESNKAAGKNGRATP